MTKLLDPDTKSSAATSLGWHVHYAVNGHVRVQLACDREAAINMARTHLSENREVLRLIRCDAREIVDGRAVRIVCTKRPPSSEFD